MSDEAGDKAKAVETRGLCKRWGSVKALGGASITVGRGEIYGLLGPNGAGKSTLIRILAGGTRPTSGSAAVFGLDATRGQIDVARRSFILTDGAGLYPGLTLRKNAEVFMRLSGLKGADLKTSVSGCLALAKLEVAASRLFKDCSAGMKQRLKLALGFAKKADLMVLDEPTTSLDADGIADFKETVRDLNRTAGTTFLISSHMLLEMQDLCSRAAVLRNGAVAAQGSMADLLGKSSEVRVLCAAPEAAAAAAGLAGMRVIETRGDSVRVTATGEEVPRLVEALVAAGVRVHGVVPLLPTLEERYFRGAGPVIPVRLE